jgi:glycosyltransferase involved in cell wall biosynthesis
MNIGIDIKAFKNGKTGISRYLRTLMDHLQEIDHENDYYLFECVPSKYKITNLRWKIRTTSWKLPGILWQQVVLPFYLKSNKIDVLWAPEQICPVFCKGAHKIITTIYDLTALRFPETCQTTNLLIQKCLFPMTMRRSTLLIPISDFVKQEVEYFYPKHSASRLIKVVPCGGPDWVLPSDHDRFKRENFLFFAGNMEPRKNLPRLIDALELLHNSGFKVPLHVAGPLGWKHKELRDKIEASPIRDSIKFVGYLSEEELQAQYLKCKAVIYPSYYEGFGLPVLEAFSMNTPVLTSKGTVMEEIAGDLALYFDPFDPVSIATTIRGLLNSEFKEITESKKNSILEKYKWRDSAKLLKSCFECVAGNER